MSKTLTTDGKFGALEQRVTGVESALQAISGQITTLQSTLTERAKTPWGTLISGLGVALVIGGGYTNLSREPVDQAIVTLRNDVTSIEAGLVPRGEHERVWSSFDGKDLDQQRQIDELKSAVGGIYGARDIIQEMRARIERLEGKQ